MPTFYSRGLNASARRRQTFPAKSIPFPDETTLAVFSSSANPRSKGNYISTRSGGPHATLQRIRSLSNPCAHAQLFTNIAATTSAKTIYIARGSERQSEPSGVGQSALKRPFPSLPFPSLPFPSLPFPSLPFPSLLFRSACGSACGSALYCSVLGATRRTSTQTSPFAARSLQTA